MLVVIITTGGTIASRYDAVRGGVAPAPGSIEGTIGSIEAPVALHVIPFSSVLGGALSPDDLFAIAREALSWLDRPDVCGVVVTAGTGAIEEGSYFCDLLNTTEKPIVWTGAQLDAGAADTDGPRNLVNAVRTAACPEARGLGAMVCFNELIHAARDVQKAHKSNVATFDSMDLGILGRADEDRIVFTKRLPQRPRYAPARIEVNVDLIKVVLGSDDRFFRASVAAGARAVVVEGFPGLGVVSPGARLGMLHALERGVAVILAARSPMGRMRPKYAGGIGAKDLVEAGTLLAGELTSVKARVLAMVALGHGADLGAALADA
ncbi:asparaginase [Sorangium cellulosum]|uniref:Asparaginase n=1 Tax=Sorangium cellulosum TaxID=56 RepID=A0A4P2QB30_SORCE|nr:asparaginase [Sorangium cellulosum]AUX26894.1 asparaginase [Sorangium cellulosum]